MEVIAYLHQSDFIVQDEHRAAVIGESSYVLSLGDHVYIDDHSANNDCAEVRISFYATDHAAMHRDIVKIKFQGDHEQLKHYLKLTTVH